MPDKYTQLESLINRLYTYDHLNQIYKTYLYKFASEFGLDSNNKTAFKKQRRFILVKMLAEVFKDKEKFNRLYSDMPKKIKQIFLRLVWEKGSHSLLRLQKEFDVELITYEKDIPSWRNEAKISKYCYLFSLKTSYSYHDDSFQSQHYSTFLADDIRVQLKKHLAPHLNANLFLLIYFLKITWCLKIKGKSLNICLFFTPIFHRAIFNIQKPEKKFWLNQSAKWLIIVI